MSKQPEDIWKIKPRTKVKHQILGAYVSAWVSIVAQKFSRAVFVDGFCGPGQYEGGEPGSPLIAIEAAEKALATRGNLFRSDFQFVLYCIDSNSAWIANLKSILSKQSRSKEIILHEPQVGTFEDKIAPVLAEFEAHKDAPVPLIVFIDPFGVLGYSIQTIQRIMELTSSEVFMLLDVDGMERILSAWKDPANRRTLVETAGLNEAELTRINNLNDQRQRIAELRREFFHTLRREKIGRWRVPFRMYDANDKSLYDLVFITNNPLGFGKMKEAMWRVDDSGQLRFSEGDAPGQMQLSQLDPPDQRLWRSLLKKFSGQVVQASAVNDYVKNGTLFLEKHKTAALRAHESDQIPPEERIVVHGRKKGPKGYPDYVAISFPGSGAPK